MNSLRKLAIADKPFSGKCVVYVMSRDMRVNDNHALLEAQEVAIENNASLYVLFVLKQVQNRSNEHYKFMLEGLEEVANKLESHNIPFVIKIGIPLEEILEFSKQVEAGTLIFDFNPLKGARNIVKNVARCFNGAVTVVDTHNIIPVWTASNKQEFAAHTMRSKVHKYLKQFLVEPPALKTQTFKPDIDKSNFKDAYKFIESIPESGIRVGFKSGEEAAKKHLDEFIKNKLETYALSRNNIAEDNQSGLSPYLHFGQISSLRVALGVLDQTKLTPLLFEQAKLAEHSDTPNSLDGMNALFEEMIVRKELSDNFCFYTENYLSFKGAPDWAKKSLSDHAKDPRDFVYTKEQWEQAATHDEIWNASQKELLATGKIHGYMRMYWAKKILEWSKSPEEAIATAIHLNDKYSIDGGDPNGYVGILWSIAGLHDRPWFERPVYGKIRYMNDAGLKRKFDVDKYIKGISIL